MNSIDRHAKILIVEHRSAQLIALTVWLSQFAKLQVAGSLSGTNLRGCIENELDADYDLIIFGLELVKSDEIPFRLIVDFSLLRKLKWRMDIPILLLISGYGAGIMTNNAREQIYTQIFNECDSVLPAQDTLRSIYIEITRLLAYKRRSRSSIKKLVAGAR